MEAVEEEEEEEEEEQQQQQRQSRGGSLLFNHCKNNLYNEEGGPLAIYFCSLYLNVIRVYSVAS